MESQVGHPIPYTSHYKVFQQLLPKYNYDVLSNGN